VVDLLQVLEGVTYAAFIVGALVAVYELRVMSRDRRTELYSQMGEHWTSREFEEAMAKYALADYQSAESIEKTVPRVDILMIADTLDWMAALVRYKIVDYKTVTSVMTFSMNWEKLKPWCLEWRKHTTPGHFGDFEWLANEENRRDKAAEQETNAA